MYSLLGWAEALPSSRSRASIQVVNGGRWESMPSRRKLFSCGHRGRGKFCHRCDVAEKAAAQRQREVEHLAARVSEAPVPLSGLPPQVVEKALKLFEQLKAGTPYAEFRGKRLVTIHQREVISVPLGRRYRMICREEIDLLTFLEVISHETYNNRLASGGWPGRQ